MHKKEYHAPCLLVEWIETEYSIAAGSATVNVGSPDGQYRPEVNEWNEGDYRSIDMDI